jgi:hypothetical protein
MTKFKLLISISFLITNATYSQKCTCESNFQWVKKTFEENDAGFAYYIDKKGNDAYELHNKEYLAKIKKLPNNKECAETINQWLRFFRNGHIGVEYIKSAQESKETKIGTFVLSENDLKKHLDNSDKKDKYEGIWTYDGYKIGIQKRDDKYIGYIISSTNQNWKQFEVKTTFTEKNGTLYLGNKTSLNIQKVTTFGNTYLALDNTLLKKVYPIITEDSIVEKGIKQLFTPRGTHYFEKLNENTAYLRITFFDIPEKKKIDSIIAKNRDIILSTKNLIIDVRNNPGGSDESFAELIPFLYTNPIRNVNTLFYSTKLNNQRMLDLSKNMDFDETTRKELKSYYETLNASVGQYVNIFGNKVDITTLGSITNYPKNIAIIINEKNGSTTEQFLLTAKQSNKVKLFGVTTYGALDISNVNDINSPCGDIKLFYGVSKSFRIPAFAIDDIGLQPDFFIDDTIEKYDWVNYVNQVLNEK